MNSVYTIAEAGVNHNGDMETALRLIDAAKDSGADAVKFQTGVPKLVISKFAPKAEYQLINGSKSESQLDMCKKISLQFDDFKIIKEYCQKVKIDFLSTPFDLTSIQFLQEMGMPVWKIPSGEITNLPYLLKIAKIGKPVLLSTGMSELYEIRVAVQVLQNNGCGKITLLQCNTEYPTPYRDVNLKVMQSLKQEFLLPVGLSDHSLGIEIPIAAAAMGAEIIEKHFTLDRTMEGPDHKASLEPPELKRMLEGLRHVEEAMGTGEKKCSPSERKNREVARKSIVASRAIKKGEIFSEKNLAVKRPGNGISPMKWFDVLGNPAIKDFEEDEQIIL